MLRNIFSPKRDDHNHTIQSWVTGTILKMPLKVIKSQKLQWTIHVTSMGESRTTYNVFLIGKPRGKRPIGGWKEDGETRISK